LVADITVCIYVNASAIVARVKWYLT